MSRRRVVLLAIGVCVAAPVYAEPATAQYAPVQLQVAQRALDRAQQMLRQGKARSARRLAAQAALDARLAWTMTDSDFLREQAAAIYAESSRLNLDVISMKEQP